MLTICNTVYASETSACGNRVLTCPCPMTSYLACMRSPVDELSRKKKSQCPVECSFLRNSVISPWMSKVDPSTCRSRSQLSNALLEVMLQELRSKLSPSKLWFCKVCAFSAQFAKVMGPQVHRTSGDCILTTLVPLQALDLQLHDAVWILLIA